jgi:hypothetical protein
LKALSRFILLGMSLGAWLVSGCGLITSTQLPTQLPTGYVPTAIALTVAASQPKQPSGETEQPSPEPTYPPSPTPSPAASPTPTIELVDVATPTPKPVDQPISSGLKPPAGLPNKPIQILSPGPASRVTSPFLLRSTVLIGPSGVVRLELLGEDGRLLMREVQRYGAAAGKQMGLGVEIKYEISAAAETGRLQIGVEDEQGRLMAQSSVDLILLSLGDPDIALPADQLEDIYIEVPRPNALIQGGQVRVSGLARTRSELPLMIEFQAGDGRIVGTRQIAVETVPGSTHGTFMADVPFTVESPTRVRLVIWEPGDQIPGIVHLSSEELVLSP